MDKYPLTIRLDDELMKVVRVQATLTRSSLGSVVVDAARQALMPEYQQKQEQVLLQAMNRCFNRLVKMHEDQQAQHELVREMLAMFVRTFFRHTPSVKPEYKESAWARHTPEPTMTGLSRSKLITAHRETGFHSFFFGVFGPISRFSVRCCRPLLDSSPYQMLSAIFRSNRTIPPATYI